MNYGTDFPDFKIFLKDLTKTTKYSKRSALLQNETDIMQISSTGNEKLQKQRKSVTKTLNLVIMSQK